MSAAPAPLAGREGNLARVLRLVHESGPTSRAQLTQALAVNRSTVGSLVGELVALGIVEEDEPPGTGVAGRPSPIVRLHDSLVAVGVGVELDAVTVALVDGHGVVVDRARRENGGDLLPDTAIGIARELGDDLLRRRDAPVVVGVGAAVPGLVRTSDGVVRIAPHLGWRDVPFADALADAFGVPAAAANDASIAADAEAIFGVGRHVRDLVYLHGGPSGIGAGVRVGGGTMPSRHGMHAELGHTVVDIGGRVCHCSARGCLETEVRYSTLLEALGVDALDLRALPPALRTAGGPVLDRIVATQLERLAVGIRTAINAFNPDLIVLGGFLGAIYDEQPDTLMAALRGQVMAPLLEGVEVVRGSLGVEGLLVGAAELAWGPLLDAPDRTGGVRWPVARLS